jgi:ABC-type oligopeptide transport system substrate-binding subunit
MESRILLMKKLLAAIILANSLVLIGCASANGTANPATSENPAVTEPSATANVENRITATGTIRYLNISGGFWGIVGDDGKNYDPMGLASAFQKEDLRVRFEAIPETDMMSSRMWGTLVKITHIEAL